MYGNLTVTGYVPAEPKYFNTQNGMKIMSFSVAIKNQNKDTGWLQIKVFGKGAEFAEGQLHKGMFFSASGRLQPFGYTAKDGTQKDGWELNTHQFGLQFQSAENRPQAQQSQPQQRPPAQNYAPPPPAQSQQQPDFDDIPF